MLETGAPRFSLAEAETLACDRFDIDGVARLLTSERDQNFHLSTPEGGEFVLKIANLSEAPETIDSQNAVLRHLEAADPGLPCPRVVPTRDGAPTATERGHIVRVLTWRSGRLMHQVSRTPLLRRSLGKVHAQLAKALQTCKVEPPPNDLLWDLQNAGQLRALLLHIASPVRAGVLASVLDRFEARAQAQLSKAATQIIHNDLNPHNVVVNEAGEVSGIIDFGDMVRAPLICDVAVAAAYHVCHDSAPLADTRDYVDAFCDELPLPQAELDLLPDLIAVRLAMTVLITNWRANLYPENSAYILRNEPHAWRGLEAMVQAERLT